MKMPGCTSTLISVALSPARLLQVIDISDVGNQAVDVKAASVDA